MAVARHLWGSPVHAAAVDLLDVRPGEHIVDLGAGLGPATVLVARRVGATGSVIAIDPSLPMRMAVALRRIAHPGRSSISICNGISEKLPVPDAAVDAVLGLNLVHLLSDVGAAAAEIARTLRSGGRVLFVEEDLDDSAHTFHHATPHHADGPSLDQFVAALDGAGLDPSPPQRRRLGGQPVHTITAAR